MDSLMIIVVLVVVVALFFDFTNGFHDTANAMATPIATGAMKPKVAVGLAAILNLVGAFLSTEVAKTVSGGIIREGPGGIAITPEMIFAGLVGAVVWNMLTWRLGLPSSSSHALFGGLIGAALVGAGVSAVNYWSVVDKILLPALLAPAIAGVTAYACTKIAYKITRRSDGSRNGRAGFRYAQIFSSSLVALSHGTNDAQKTMGVITLVLIAANMQEAGTGPELWVIVACAATIAAGTYAGGWRIIQTMGSGLTRVKPAQGFAAEASTAATILASSHLGFALSTTQVASGSVIGSGLGRKRSEVRWKVARRIGMAWLLTLPGAGIVGGLAAAGTLLGTIGVVGVSVIGFGTIGYIFLDSRRNSDDARPTSGVARAGRVVKIRKKKRKRKGKKKRQQRQEAAAIDKQQAPDEPVREVEP